MEKPIQFFLSRKGSAILWCTYLFVLVMYSFSMQDMYAVIANNFVTTGPGRSPENFVNIVVVISTIVVVLAQFIGIFTMSIFLLILLKAGNVKIKFWEVAKIYLLSQIFIIFKFLYTTFNSSDTAQIIQNNKWNVIDPFLIINIGFLFIILKIYLKLDSSKAFFICSILYLINFLTLFFAS